MKTKGGKIDMGNKIMKIGGKTPSNTVKGIAVNSNGEVITTKKWQTDKITVLEQTGIVSAETFSNLNNPVDLSEYGIVSLRIDYLMPDADTTINLRGDLNPNGTTWMFNKDGSATSFVLPATAEEKIIIITPDELSVLPYLHYLRLRIQPNSAPSSEGYMKIYAIVKR